MPTDTSPPPSRGHSNLLAPALALALFASVVCPGSAFALTLRQENFEAPPDGLNYTVFGEHGTNTVSINQYFKRGSNGSFSMPVPLQNLHGASFWAGEDTDFAGPGECRVTLPPIDIRGFQNLRVTWAVAIGRDAAFGGTPYESADYLILQTALDGADWTNNSVFRGPAASGYLREDTNRDGIGDGTQLTRTFADFQPVVAGLGTGLHVRVILYMSATDEEAAFDDLRITGDAILPSLTITNPSANALVTEAVSNFNVQGYANLGVVSFITWTNALTGESGVIPASTNWTIAGLPLAPGLNTITVTGSNTVGNVTNRSVTINRVLPPVIDILSPPAATNVSDLTTAISLTGSASTFTVGTLRWTNSLTGDSGTLPAATNWSIPNVPLNMGTNLITVSGTNLAQQATSVTVAVYRVPIPALAILGPQSGTRYDHTTLAVALTGTAGPEAFGLLAWTNLLNGVSGTAAAQPNWSTPQVTLGFGTNLIVVTASNIVGRTVSATVSVHRVDAPQIAITAPVSPALVAEPITTIDLQGTANGVVVGLLRWTNVLNGTSGTGTPAAVWSLNALPLALGTNVITITGSNIVNRTASATASVYRIPDPVLAITAPATPPTVPHATATYVLAGTASATTAGQLTWSNALNGASGTTLAQANWSVASLPLAAGLNPITIHGTNLVGRPASAQTVIAREGSVLLNETLINPTADDVAADHEFVELLQPAGGGTANGLSLLALDGNAPTFGVVTGRWDLAGLAFGTNGILLLGPNYTNGPGGSWSNLVSPHAGFGAAGLVPGALPNGSLSLLLVRNATAPAGTDLDGNDDGQLDAAPWSELIDSVGWRDADPADRVYATAVLAQTGGAPGAATRVPTNRIPGDRSAWYHGDIDPNDPGAPDRLYVPDAASSNLPAGAVLTPGRFNFPAPTDQDGDGLPNAWEQQYFGDSTNSAAQADPDGDGQHNEAEYWAGTDPTNPASFFVVGDMVSTGLVTISVVTNGDVVTQIMLTVEAHDIKWASIPNRMYRILGTANLKRPFTNLSAVIPATPPVNTYTSVLGTNRTFHYRIGVLEPVYP